MAVPVHIVAGFLGSGKTSAIRAQLDAREGERVAVIVNDFGEAGFDEAALSVGAPFQILNIPGGCVCCTAPAGFLDALGAVLEQGPDRLLVEPTGLARPQDLVDTLRRGPHRDAVEVAPVVVLVDPRRLDRGEPAERALLEEQAEIADVLVANHTDLCDEEHLARFDAWAGERWPAPLAVHRTRHGRIPPELLQWPSGEGPRLSEPAASGHAHAHEGHTHEGNSTDGWLVRSWRWASEEVFDREKLGRAVLRLGEGLAGAPLARFKGVFRTREGVFQMEFAGGTPHERPSAWRRDSRADAIFRTEEAGPLELAQTWLDGARVGPAELRARAREIEVALPDGRVALFDRARLQSLPDPVADVSTLVSKRAGSAARVRALLDAVDAPPEGHAIVCAADGFASEPVPLRALGEGVLLHSLEGQPVEESKGGPFRLLIPPGVADAPSACANVKAVTRIVIRR